MTETTKTKEQAILAAAEQEFLAKGFDGARTTSIAAAAGVTHAMLHYYFRTKENIFERILDEKLRLMGESVLAASWSGSRRVFRATSTLSPPIPTCRVSSSMKFRRSPSVTT